MTEFKSIKLGDIFEIKKTKGFNKRELRVSNDGEYDYITRTSLNNGIESITHKVPKRIINEANTFSLGLLQMTFFYRERPWYAGQFVRKIVPKFNANTSVMLYMLVYLKSLSPKLLSVLVRDVDRIFEESTVNLPVVSGTMNLDFQYMEDRVKALEQDRVKALANYLTVTGLNDYQLTDEEQKILDYEPELREFTIEEVFEIKKGKRLTKANQIPGNTLFIGSTAINHGETARIGQEPIFEESKITVCYNGSVGETFYQEEPFWASDDINVLTLKGRILNSKIGEYLSAILRKAGQKYGYTYKWNVSRMKKSIIKLPVKPGTTDIDFDYMEKYIKAIQKLTIKDVVQYKDKFIEETKKLVN